MEQPVNINININLTELPKCSCGEGFLLPVEDVEKDGTPYLKGWFCPACKTSVLFRAGSLVSEAVSTNPLSK